MSERINISAGLDLHKKFIEAAILTSDNTYLHKRFNRDKNEIFQLRDWLCENHVEIVACESTSDYWRSVYFIINPKIPVIVGNAYDMKICLHKKTDELDAEHIALLVRSNLVEPSRIFLEESYEFRSTTRLRHKLVQYRSSIKNQIHHILESQELHLSRILSDIFGKAGMVILKGISNGTPFNEIIANLPPKMAEKLISLQNEIAQKFSPEAITRLETCLKILESMNKYINELTIAARHTGQSLYGDKIEIAMSMPGIGEVSAITLLAEIGEITDFDSADKLTSWFGLVPRIYQSAGKLYVGSLTKRGTATGRWILNQIAHAAIKAKDNAFRRFYEAKEAVIGKKKAIMAVARKILAVLWHLLTNNEFYNDDTYKKINQPKNVHVIIPSKISMEDVFKIFSKAHIVLNESQSNSGGV